MINAIKFSGTTNSKLSIGLLNAITGEANATIRNIDNGSVRKENLAPVTNYNVISLTQQLLNDYSSVGIHNTNVNRSEGGLNANNTVFVTDLFDEKRNFNFRSRFYFSKAPRLSEKNGFRGSISLEELRGNVQFAAGWVGTDKYYNQNELGYFNQLNNQRVYTRIRYQIFEENKMLRNYSNYLYMGQTWRYDTSRRTRNGFRFGNDFEFQNLYKIEFDLDYTGIVEDYYETRNVDRFLIVPSDFEVKLGLNSNPTKRFTFNFDFLNKGYKNKQFDEEKKYQRFDLNFDYRFSNNLSAKFSTQRDKTHDDIGYLFTEGENIYFGIRDQKTIENSIDVDYRIDNKKSINLNFRNFWSVADYDEILFKLKDDGYREITDYALLKSNPNTNFNIWNLDVKFQWWFNPGSNLIFLYRNQIFNRDNQSGLDYYKSLKNLFETPVEHQISLRINYLIDANLFRKK